MTEIHITGNFNLDTQIILDNLRIAKEKYLAPYALSLDILHLKEMYRKQGFLFVDIKTETKSVEGWIDLYFIIDEGPQVAVLEINFFGNVSFDKGDLLASTQTQETGLFSSTYYDEDAFQEDFCNIHTDGYVLLSTLLDCFLRVFHQNVHAQEDDNLKYQIECRRVRQVDGDLVNAG